MSILKHTPEFTGDEAAELARRFYGISVMASPLPSDRDQNFRLETEGDRKSVV